MKVIGLTGGIGSGKTTVSMFLAELGAIIMDADKVGHELIKPGSNIWRQVADAFGNQILTDGDVIDRKRLGEIIFNDSEARIKLNKIMHPPMYSLVQGQLEVYKQQGVKVIVLEAPVLLDAGWASLVDEVWVTIASENTIMKRLKQRSGLSERDIKARISSQLKSEERIKFADVVIDTDCSLEELKEKVKVLWRKLQPR